MSNATQQAIDYLNSSIVGPFAKGFTSKPGVGATSGNTFGEIGDALANATPAGEGFNALGKVLHTLGGAVDISHILPLAMGMTKADEAGNLFGNALRNSDKLVPDASLTTGNSLKDINSLVSHEPIYDPSRVQYYKDLINGGQAIDPLLVIKEGEKYGVEDGKHRLQALKELGFKFAPTQEK